MLEVNAEVIEDRHRINTLTTAQQSMHVFGTRGPDDMLDDKRYLKFTLLPISGFDMRDQL